MSCHQALSFGPFLDILCMPRRHLDEWRPCGPALYIFHEDTRIYIGETKSLAGRLKNSLREQGFGDTIICILLNPQWFPSKKVLREMRKNLEALCISALHTLTWGHGTPLSLTNEKHVKILEDVAWCSDHPEDISLALSIARTLLYAIGMPPAWFGLPCRLSFRTNLPDLIAQHNEKTWPLLLRKATCHRRKMFEQAVALSGSPKYSLAATLATFYAKEVGAQMV